MITKRSVLIAGVLLVCAIGAALFFMYRSEDRVPNESELVKYPEFKPFLVGKTSFRGIRFNVDTNLYSFAFTTTAESADTFFAEVTKALTGTDWRLAASDTVKRIYMRQSPPSAKLGQMERVTLTFNPENKEVTFVRENVSSSS